MMKIALWQAHSTPRDIDDNIQRLRETAKRAKAGGAQLLVTPEMFLTGYAIEEGFVDLAKSDPLALAARVAGDVGIGIVAGGPELIDGKVYNSTVFADETGTELHPVPKSAVVWLDGSRIFRAQSREVNGC